MPHGMTKQDCGTARPNNLESHLFGKPDFRFVVYFLKTTETGKGKPVDGNRANFADGRVFYRRSTAFFMN